MKSSIGQGSGGWDEYVLYGTKNKPRDQSKIYVLDGDIQLGNALCENNKYEDKYYRIVLAFKGKPTDKKMKEAYQEFKENFFIGFSEDEYHTDAVVHKDTDNYHIHIRVPKQNLLTNTELQLYMHSIDVKRKDLLQEYLSMKYEPRAEQQSKALFREDKKIDRINKQRAERNQPEFTMTKAKGKKEAEKKINEYMSEMIYAGMINTRAELKEAVESLGVEIVNEGYDKTKDFHYLTIENDSGKMRIKGDIYADEFFGTSREDRQQQIASNTSLEREQRGSDRTIEAVQRELRKANEKRFKKVSNLFRTAREKARADIRAVNHEAIDNFKSKDIINRDSVKSITGADTRGSNLQSDKPDKQRDTRTAQTHGAREQGYEQLHSRASSVASSGKDEIHPRGSEVHQEPKHLYKPRQENNIHQARGEIDERTRTAIERRTRERDRILQEVGKTNIAQPRAIREELEADTRGIQEHLSGLEKVATRHIEQDSQPIYEQAQRVVQQRREQRTIRERLRETLDSVRNKFEQFTNGIRARFYGYTNELRNINEQSESLTQSAQRHIEEIDRQNEPDHSFPRMR